MSADIFAGAPIIHRYTRAEALADGALIDVSRTAREAGFVAPVAVTAALWGDIITCPTGQDPEGRLWDVLWMGFLAARRNQGGAVLTYPLIMRVGRRRNYRVKMVAGPGDDGHLVITLMRPEED